MHTSIPGEIAPDVPKLGTCHGRRFIHHDPAIELRLPTVLMAHARAYPRGRRRRTLASAPPRRSPKVRPTIETFGRSASESTSLLYCRPEYTRYTAVPSTQVSHPCSLADPLASGSSPGRPAITFLFDTRQMTESAPPPPPRRAAGLPAASSSGTTTPTGGSRWKGKASAWGVKALDKAMQLSDKIAPHVNDWTEKVGGERWWPSTNDFPLEVAKCTRILRAFTVDGVAQTVEETDETGAKRKRKAFRKIPAEVLRAAKGIVVYTSMRSGIAPLGGSGGSGLICARLPDGSWSAPSCIAPGESASVVVFARLCMVPVFCSLAGGLVLTQVST